MSRNRRSAGRHGLLHQEGGDEESTPPESAHRTRPSGPTSPVRVPPHPPRTRRRSVPPAAAGVEEVRQDGGPCSCGAPGWNRIPNSAGPRPPPRHGSRRGADTVKPSGARTIESRGIHPSGVMAIRAGAASRPWLENGVSDSLPPARRTSPPARGSSTACRNRSRARARQLEDARVAARRALRVDAVGAAGKDDALAPARAGPRPWSAGGRISESTLQLAQLRATAACTATRSRGWQRCPCHGGRFIGGVARDRPAAVPGRATRML